MVVLAEHQAKALNHFCIGTEHLALALIADGDGVAGRALAALGVSHEAMRQRVVDTTGLGQQAPDGYLPIRPTLKLVLERADQQAIRLGRHIIDTEHLLLSLLAEGHDLGARILSRSGADPDRVREQVDMLGGGASDSDRDDA